MEKSSIQSRFLRYLPFWFVLLTGLCLFTSHIVGFRLEYFPGDMGDGRLNMYCLEHAHRFITGQTPSLWDAPFMFPEKDVITYSENLIGSAPVYSLFRILGADRELAYQLWYIAIVILNFTAAYFFLKSFTKNPWASALGAFVFAFSLALQSQMTHAQTFPRFAIPIAFWMAYLFYRDLKVRHFLLMLLAAVFQFYCSIYLGMMLLPVIAVLSIALLIMRRHEIRAQLKEWRWITGMLASMLLTGAGLFALMWPYFLRSEGQPVKSLRDVWMTLPTPGSYVYSQPGSLLWDSLSEVGSSLPAFWDHQLFPGIITCACVILGVAIILSKKNYPAFLPDRRWMLLMLIAFSATFILFLKVGEVTLYTVLFNLPGFKALRSLTRIINIELVFFASLIALVYARVESTRVVQRAQLFVFLIFFGLLVADNYFHEGRSYRTAITEQREEMAVWGELVQDLPAGSIVSFEVDSICKDATRHQISGMLCAQEHGLICLNGYTATSPVGFDAYWMNPNAKTRRIWLEHMNFPEDRVHIVSIP